MNRPLRFHAVGPLAATLAGIVLLGLCAGPPPACPGEGELALSPVAAFSIGARTRVQDVAVLKTSLFNDTLRTADARGEPWARNFIAIALRFAHSPPQGRDQSVRVTTAPGDWEPGVPLHWAKVTIEDRGWLDDCVVGERWVIWIVPDGDGEGLSIARALHAEECSRSTPESWFYATRCP